jgi:hypothetical protein
MQERLREQLDRHPHAITAGVIGGALALVVVAVGLAIAVFSGARPAAEASPIPSSSVSPSASPTDEASPSTASVEPSATPSPPVFVAPDDVLPPGSAVDVIVDGLQIRAGPGLDARVVFAAPAGSRFYASIGPITVDGLDWYRLATMGDSVLWAAIGSGSERYLEVVTPDCPPADPDLATIVAMSNDWDRLACFGGRPLSFTGTYGCGECGGTTAGSFEPYWLAAPTYISPLWVEWGIGGVLELHLAPDSGLAFPPEGSIVRTSGHFNDPASTTCEVSMWDGEQVIAFDPRTAELFCRERFVVDAFEIIGTDPAFP